MKAEKSTRLFLEYLNGEQGHAMLGLLKRHIELSNASFIIWRGTGENRNLLG